MRKSSKSAVCPLQIRFATFCRAILNEGVDRSLYTILPGFTLVIQREPNPSDTGVADMGSLAVYALLERAPGIIGKIESTVRCEFDLPSIPGMERNPDPTMTVILEAQHEFFHFGLNIERASIPVDTRKAESVFEMTCKFIADGTYIGMTRLPIRIKVAEPEVAKKTPSKKKAIQKIGKKR